MECGPSTATNTTAALRDLSRALGVAGLLCLAPAITAAQGTVGTTTGTGEPQTPPTQGGGFSLPNWKDVGFWAADAGLNFAQKDASKKVLDRYKDIFEYLRLAYGGIQLVTGKNRQLHKDFLNELGSINPIVADYFKILEITNAVREVFDDVGDQVEFIGAIADSGTLSEDELNLMVTIFEGMRGDGLALIDEVLAVSDVDAGADLQMMDSERIRVIDRVHADVMALTTRYHRYREFFYQLAERRQPGSIGDVIELYAPVP